METLLNPKILEALKVAIPFAVIFGVLLLLTHYGESERVYSNSTKKPKKHPFRIVPHGEIAQEKNPSFLKTFKSLFRRRYKIRHRGPKVRLHTGP